VFVTNVVKHRPPNNRTPSRQEIGACAKYLRMEVQLVHPKIIVPLGRVALFQWIPGGSIRARHGVALGFAEFFIIPTYHPAAALRSSEVRRLLATDFQNLGRLLERVGQERASD
jgi:DNA polymerase